MKRLFIVLGLGFISASAGFAQSAPASTGTTSSNDPFEVQSRVYTAAIKNYDFLSATSALYTMIALKPERTDLNDSLALTYFKQERYAQSYLTGEEILKNNPNRPDILELVAVSKQSLGLIKESLADYEKLYASKKEPLYLYQIATLQYQLKRFGECIASLDQLIANPESEKQKVNIRMQNGSQDVPMKAAALNVKGICAVEMNQEEIAKDNFNKAIQIFPDFALAKGNLESLNKKKTGEPSTKPSAGTTATHAKSTTAPSVKKK